MTTQGQSPLAPALELAWLIQIANQCRRPATTEEGFCATLGALMASFGFFAVSSGSVRLFKVAMSAGSRDTHSADLSRKIRSPRAAFPGRIGVQTTARLGTELRGHFGTSAEVSSCVEVSWYRFVLGPKCAVSHSTTPHLYIVFGQQLIQNARVTWNNVGQVSGPRL